MSCWKNTFATRREANKVRVRRLAEGTPTRIYPCGECGKYHLTSRMTDDHHEKPRESKDRRRGRKGRTP